MEWLVIIGLIGLFIFFGALTGFRANNRARDLEISVRNLEHQLGNLRQEILALKAQGLKPPDPTSTKTRKKPVQSATKDTTPAADIASPQPEPAITAAATAVPTRQAPRESFDNVTWDSLKERVRNQTGTKAAPKSQSAKRNMEFEFGAKWSVWVGGLALLFGAVFLLRYSIETGFFKPEMRIGMAAFLGAALLAGGEFLRRGDGFFKGKDGTTPDFLQQNYIPGVLTAVGIFTLLGTVFAAHELYGFIGATPAFTLMGLISLGALALGLLHGPYISALGLVAAFTTPALIASEEPSFLGLFAYLTIISLAAFLLTRLRDWSWLGIAAIIGGSIWLALSQSAVSPGENLIIWLSYFALIFAANHYLGRDEVPGTSSKGLMRIQHVSGVVAIFNIFLAIIVFGAIIQLPHGNLSLLLSIGIVGAFSLMPFLRQMFTPNFWIAGLLAAAIILDFGTNPLRNGIILTAVFGVLGFVYYLQTPATETSTKLFWLKWKAPALLPPILIFCTLNRLESDITNKQIGLTILVCGGLLLLAALLLDKRNRHENLPANYLTGTAIAIFMGVLLAVKMPWEIAGLAASIALFAGLTQIMQNRATRWLCLIMAAVTLLMVLRFTLGDRGSVGESFPFNELWIYLALPSAISFGSGWLLRRDGNDTPSEGLMALGIGFGLLFVLFQIRHFMTDGNIYAADFTFDEMGLYVSTGLVMTLARRWMGIKEIPQGAFNNRSATWTELAIPGMLSLLSWVTLAVFAVFVCVTLAPLFNRLSSIEGNLFANTLTLAYLIPVLLMGAILWIRRNEPAGAYTTALRLLSILGFMLFVTSQIRFGFSGRHISIFENFPQGLETYAITASWLLIGVLTLAIGVKYDRRAFRLGSGVLIILTVLKAFLVDMSTLEGVLRAISFVVLGLVLIVIGRVYQKLLFQQQN